MLTKYFVRVVAVNHQEYWCCSQQHASIMYRTVAILQVHGALVVGFKFETYYLFFCPIDTRSFMIISNFGGNTKHLNKMLICQILN